jgi:tetratricopeptide (TPR) repeat protein
MILALLVFPFFLMGKERVDSLKNELDKADHDTIKVQLLIHLWESTAYSDPSAARKFARKALVISENANYRRGIAEALQRLAADYSTRSINDSARIFYDSSLTIYTQLHDIKMEGVILSNIAMIYYSQGEYVKALLKTEESLKKSGQANDIPGIALSLQLLGNIHHYLGNYDEAQKYLIQGQKEIEKMGDGVRYADGLVYLASNYLAQDKNQNALENLYEAISIYRKHQDYFYLAQALNNTGHIHYGLGNYDSAVIYLNEAIELATQYQNNEMLLLAIYNMGLVDMKKGQINQAFDHFKNALQMAKRNADSLRIAMVSRNIGNLVVKQGKFNKALLWYDTALVIAGNIKAKSSLKETYLGISETWAKMGDYQKSLDYFIMYDQIKDSIFNEDKTRKMEEMEARYQKEKQEKEIAIQKSEIAVLSKDIELQRFRQRILIVGLIIAILFGVFILISLKNKMRKNRRIREQEKMLEQEKIKNAELQRDNFEKELAFKKNELTSHALQIVQKNELLDTLKRQISELEQHSDRANNAGYRKLRHLINGSAQSDREWENFNRHFEQVHQGFFTKLKSDYPLLTSNDLRLSAMLKLNLSSKEVASILNISPESVKKARYRLRKKLDLPEESDLHSFMINVKN